MRILAMVIRLLAMLSMATLLATGEVLSAVFLLGFASMSLGIRIGEKVNGERKYGSK